MNGWVDGKRAIPLIQKSKNPTMQFWNEGSSVSEKTLRALQDCASPGHHSCHLHEQAPQTTSGL